VTQIGAEVGSAEEEEVESETPPPANAPTIADTTYRNYDGPLHSQSVRWWVVAVTTLRRAFGRQKIAFWVIAVFIAIFYLWHGISFYISKLAQDNFGVGILNGENLYATVFHNAQTSIGFWVFVAALTIGSSSIAADNRANALMVYLSKPLTRADYLIGKWTGVFLVLLTLVLVPNLLLYAFMLGTYYNDGFGKEALPVLGKLLISSTLAPAVNTSLVIGFSAWSKSPRVAGAVYAAFYLIVAFAVEQVGQVVASRDRDNKNPRTLAVVRNSSVGGVSAGISMNLYNVTPQQILMVTDRLGRRRNRPLTEKEQQRRMRREENLMREIARPPVGPVLLIALAYFGVPILLTVQKIRAVEVIKG
jgi:ABC-2 type transport system permease protein